MGLWSAKKKIVYRWIDFLRSTAEFWHRTGADRHEGGGLIRAEDASGGTEKQGGLNTKQGVFLSLESGDDEAVIGTRPSCAKTRPF